jgi:ABC-type glycerol-3-phosphate transport system substrate-binding protein
MFAPNPAVNTSASVDGSEYLAIPSFASNPDGGLQFIELATSLDKQILQGAESPWAPVLQPALDHPDVAANLTVAPVIRQSYEYPVDGGFSPDRERWVEILTSEIALALNQTKTSKEALDEAVRLIRQSRS